MQGSGLFDQLKLAGELTVIGLFVFLSSLEENLEHGVGSGEPAFSVMVGLTSG